MKTTNDRPPDGDTTDTPDVPTGRVLVLDEQFVAALTDEKLQSYIEAVARAARGTHADVDELAGGLATDLERLDLPMPPIQVKMLAEQLFGVQDARLKIVTTGGEFLAEQDGAVGAPQRAGSAGDPEHPDRPILT